MSDPGVGYMLAWEDRSGYPKTEFHTGLGFSERAKSRVASLIREGASPRCFALVKVFEMVEKPEAGTAILADDWMPVLNHIIVRQQKGELMQVTPRGRPQKTLAELREGLNGSGESGKTV